MGTVIMMFIFPLGVVFYYFDKRTKIANKKLLAEHADKYRNTELPDSEKLKIIDEMYYQNGYQRVLQKNGILTMEKKHFNIGVVFMLLGLFSYFGPFIYIIYYKFFLKPEQIEISV